LKTKKTHLYLGLLCTVIIGMYLATPLAIAAPAEFIIPEDSPWGWASLSSTVTDPVDDVVRYTSNPGGGAVGDYHDEIDIANVSVQYALDIASSLYIVFSSESVCTTSYVYIIFIDSDLDNQADYIIFNNITISAKGFAVDFYLQRLSDGYYWASSWGPTVAHMDWTASTNYFCLSYISDAIPTISSAQVAMVAAYIDDPSYLYADFLPLTPSADSIPGFPLGFVLFGMITLLGLVLIVQRNQIWI
jgi:hypothetical protein